MRFSSLCVLLILAALAGVVPAQESPRPEFAGDLDGRKTVLVAWSFDDGPVEHTDTLASKLGINNVTWFIVKKNMLSVGGWEENLKRYKGFQDAGGEIGLHAQHKTVDHIVWFPASKATRYTCYDSIETAMAEMKQFKDELAAAGIHSNMTRMPGGLYSQLLAYAKHLGFGGKSSKVVRALMKGDSFESLGTTGSAKQKNLFAKIEADYKTLKSSLKEMKLLLWGGSRDPDLIGQTSWEAESSGSLSLHDTITYSVTHLAQRQRRYSNYKGRYAGKFEKLADRMKDGERRSWVILAHDTSKANIDAVLQDKSTMEAHARKTGVKIEYVTMSTLFHRLTGETAGTFVPNY